MIVRAIDNPSPVPCGLVVKNVSKTLLNWSLGMPVPVSATDTSTSVGPTKGGFQRHFAGARNAVQHGIHGIERQVQGDLLQIHCVGAHGQGGLHLIDIQYNAPAQRLRIKKVERAANRVIEVKLLQRARPNYFGHFSNLSAQIARKDNIAQVSMIQESQLTKSAGHMERTPLQRASENFSSR
jgi:hypothetical protein